MYNDIQRVNMFKRISAYLFDLILTACLAVGLAALLSNTLNYDSYVKQLDGAYAKYEQMYDVKLSITMSEYDAMTPEEQERYMELCDQVIEALNQDEGAVEAYAMTVNLTLVIVGGSLLLSMGLLEFVVPLLFKNGQTLGKKIFGIGLMRKDSVKVTPFMMFVRTILGKYTLETMIPLVIIAGTFVFGNGGMVGIMILATIVVLEFMMPLMTKKRTGLHDLMACTVPVDFKSQRIFDSVEALEAYEKQLEAERFERSDY